MKAFAPGIYPRSEALVQATRDLDRGRTTEQAVAEQVERDTRELVAVQESAGLDLLSDGLLRWQDLFRPLAEAADGLEARPLTRFLDTNTFYRALLALQLVFGDASSVLDELTDAPVTSVGVDFYSTPLEAVPEDYPRELLAGVVDARSSALEDPAEIGTFVERLAERSPAGIALVPNGDLQFVPETIAREKLACLGRARAAQRERAVSA